MPRKPTGRPPGRRPRPPALTRNALKAVRYEFAHPDAKGVEIARAVDVSRTAVTQWRRHHLYQSELQRLRETSALRRLADDLVADLQRDQDKPTKERRRAKIAEWDISSRDATHFIETGELPRIKLLVDLKTELEAQPSRRFSVKSQIDGKTYTDPNAYWQHIKDSRAIWIKHKKNKK